MKDLSRLNLNEGGKRVTREAPTAAVVNSFQQRYSISLPQHYLELLRHSNGGHPELNSIAVGTGVKSTRWSINHFYFLDEDKDAPESLWRATEVWRRQLGPFALPFASDEGDNQYFLDLSVSPSPVKLCIHDERFWTIRIADSFEEFIDALSIDPDME